MMSFGYWMQTVKVTSPYQQLEVEHDFMTSKDEIDAAIIANEYTFTVSGRRFG